MDVPRINTIRTWLGSGSINIFGPPFAGKDTQGGRLADTFGATLLGGGDILRNSVIPPHVEDIMRTGQLIPINDYFSLVFPYLSQEIFVGKPLILSSVGRRHGEEAGVLEVTAATGHPVKAVLYLNVPDETVWERWRHSDSEKNRGKRADDTYEILQVRLEEFRQKTTPVIEFYKSQNLLIEMDSDRPTDMVSEDILRALLEFSRRD